MTKNEAINFLNYMVSKLGDGYHPDNFLSDYVDQSSNQFFTDEEIDRMSPLHDKMLEVLSHGEIYYYINHHQKGNTMGQITKRDRLNKAIEHLTNVSTLDETLAPKLKSAIKAIEKLTKMSNMDLMTQAELITATTPLEHLEASIKLLGRMGAPIKLKLEKMVAKISGVKKVAKKVAKKATKKVAKKTKVVKKVTKKATKKVPAKRGRPAKK